MMSPPKKPPTSAVNGWNEWGNHVLLELERLNNSQKELATKQQHILVEIGRLKTLSSIWGAVAGGAVGFVIALIIALARG